MSKHAKRRLWQGARPRWVPLRWWEQAFGVGYDTALSDVVSGYVDPATGLSDLTRPAIRVSPNTEGGNE